MSFGQKPSAWARPQGSFDFIKNIYGSLNSILNQHLRLRFGTATTIEPEPFHKSAWVDHSRPTLFIYPRDSHQFWLACESSCFHEHEHCVSASSASNAPPANSAAATLCCTFNSTKSFSSKLCRSCYQTYGNLWICGRRCLFPN